jgi:T5SS/PEP-CTERM-associated repeat protein
MTGNLTAGGAGKGTMTVSAGANLAVMVDLPLGDELASKGMATITGAGSEISVGGGTTIGGQGREPRSATSRRSASPAAR